MVRTEKRIELLEQYGRFSSDRATAVGNYGCKYITEDNRMTNKQAAITVIKQLRSNGFEALLAGGCVRDMLLRTARQ